MSRFPFAVVVFDLDGTLVDSAPDLTAAMNHALAALDRPPVPAAEVRHMVGHGARALLRQGLAFGGAAPDEALVERGMPIFLDHYEANIAVGTRPFEGVETALRELAERGATLAICTNKIERFAVQLVEAFGWSDMFAAVIGGDTLHVSKPDPAPLREAIARAGGGHAAFVGDSITDTETARAAAVPCVALTFGFSDRPPEQLGADLLIDHFDELVPALERLGGA